jgi:hypothetical protein
MSELIIEDDPDPLSGSINGYRINLETGTAYDGYELSQYYRETEAQQAERRNVGRLSATADRILRDYEAEGDSENTWVHNATDDIFLRRRRFERRIGGGGTFNFSMYFFVDRSNGQDYCRSWWSESASVNWCQQEKRVEPAADVTTRLETAFPARDNSPVRQRDFGRSVLHSFRQAFRPATD